MLNNSKELTLVPQLLLLIFFYIKLFGHVHARKNDTARINIVVALQVPCRCLHRVTFLLHYPKLLNYNNNNNEDLILSYLPLIL